MKKPRLTDFDPNAKMAELASPMDGFPVIGRPKRTEELTPAAPVESPPSNSKDTISTGVRPHGSTFDRASVRRTKTRYAFEFFQDQIETLRQMSLEQKISGEQGSMSEMVREAIDAYTARRLNQRDGGTDER